MASNIETVVPYDTVAHFDRIAARIEQTIDPLIGQLTERKATLLQEVAQLRDDFHNKEAARLTAVEELEQTQLQLQRMSLKSNVNLPVHEQAGLVYQQAKQQLCVPTPLPNLVLLLPLPPPPSVHGPTVRGARPAGSAGLLPEASTHPDSWEERERCEGA